MWISSDRNASSMRQRRRGPRWSSLLTSSSAEVGGHALERRWLWWNSIRPSLRQVVSLPDPSEPMLTVKYLFVQLMRAFDFQFVNPEQPWEEETNITFSHKNMFMRITEAEWWKLKMMHAMGNKSSTNVKLRNSSVWYMALTWKLLSLVAIELDDWQC